MSVGLTPWIYSIVSYLRFCFRKRDAEFLTFGVWDKITVVPTVTRTVGLRSPDRSRHPPDRDFTSFCQPTQPIACANHGNYFPIGLQPVGVLPELHYVIHVCRRIFVRRLHRYKLEAKPAQLRRAKSSAQRSCLGFSETHSCDVSSTPELCMFVPAGIQQSQAKEKSCG